MGLLSRRQLLGVLTGSAANLLLPRHVSAAMPGGARAQALAGVLRHRASAAALGRLYLATAPSERDIDGLVGLLWPRLVGGVPSAGETARDLRSALAECIRTDFATGRMVDVDGWMLAQSEARLYALCALLEPPSGLDHHFRAL